MKTGRSGEVDTQNRDGNDMTCLQVKTTCLVKSLGDGYETEGQCTKAMKQPQTSYVIYSVGVGNLSGL